MCPFVMVLSSLMDAVDSIVAVAAAVLVAVAAAVAVIVFETCSSSLAADGVPRVRRHPFQHRDLCVAVHLRLVSSEVQPSVHQQTRIFDG